MPVRRCGARADEPAAERPTLGLIEQALSRAEPGAWYRCWYHPDAG